MKLPKFVFFLLITFTVSASNSFVLCQNADQQSAANAQAMSEEDRLPFMRDEQSSDTQEPTTPKLLLKTLGAMLLVVGLIFFGAWGIKKMGFGGNKTSSTPGELELTLVSTINLGKDRSIATLRFGTRVLLVGSTPQNFTLLAEEAEHGPFTERSRSVAEMLAEENGSFDDLLGLADLKFQRTENAGGNI